VAARLMETYQRAALTLLRMRNGGRQVVTVQHVSISAVRRSSQVPSRQPGEPLQRETTIPRNEPSTPGAEPWQTASTFRRPRNLHRSGRFRNPLQVQFSSPCTAAV
jgi:hypothetical protein